MEIVVFAVIRFSNVSVRLMRIVHDENLVLSMCKHKKLTKIAYYKAGIGVQYKFLLH